MRTCSKKVECDYDQMCPMSNKCVQRYKFSKKNNIPDKKKQEGQKDNLDQKDCNYDQKLHNFDLTNVFMTEVPNIYRVAQL